MEATKISESEFRDFATSKYESLKKEFEFIRDEFKKWQSIVEALGVTKEDGVLSKASSRLKTIPPKGNQPKLTLLAKALNVFTKANCPLPIGDIMEAINSSYPDRIYETDGFSGAFSGIHRKPNSGIFLYRANTKDMTLRYLYGLRSWFDDGGHMKEEYRNKVLEKYNVS